MLPCPAFDGSAEDLNTLNSRLHAYIASILPTELSLPIPD